MGAGAKATASITGGLAFTSTDTKSVAESFTTTQTNGLTEDCNKGAIYQWSSQIQRVCGNGECVPITAPKKRLVCTTPDDLPLRTPDWEPCEAVAYSYLSESNGRAASGIAVNTDAQFRCAWNREFARNGAVIKNVNISDPDPAELPKLCRSACMDDGQCRSFSLNTITGTSGTCTLMSDIATPTAKNGYLTGKVPPKKKLTWTHCSNEFGNCTIQGDTVARYGANGTYVTKKFSGSFACNTATFGQGDPVPNVAKACEIGK